MESLGKDGVYRLDLTVLHGFNERVPKNLDVDLREVYAAESRTGELAAVNRQRAPELSSALGRGHGFAAEAYVRLSHYVNLASNALKRREAVIILDEAQQVLIEKGLTTSRSPGGSADFRAAVVAADTVYGQLQDTYEQLKAVRGLVSVKMDSLQKSYYSVMAVYKSQDTTFGMAGDKHRDLGGSNSGSGYQETETVGRDFGVPGSDDFFGALKVLGRCH